MHGFLAARTADDIGGMVLVDVVQEQMLYETWPDPRVSAVTAGLDHMQVVGLARDHSLTSTEWQALMAEEASDHHSRQAARESPYLQISRGVLAAKAQLRPSIDVMQREPLSVLYGNSRRDQEKMYESALYVHVSCGT